MTTDIEDLSVRLRNNNELILQPEKIFWKYIVDFINDSTKIDELLFKKIQENTDYGYVGRRESTPYSPFTRPETIPWQKLGNLDRVDFEYNLVKNVGLKWSKIEELQDHVNENYEILKKLLENTIYDVGVPTKALYPFCGVDIGTVLGLPGKWHLYEPEYIEKDFESRLREVNGASNHLDSNRITWSHTEDIVGADMILVKCPTPGAEYYEVLAIYEDSHPVLICDRSDLPYKKIPVLGTEMNGFRTEIVSCMFGGLAYRSQVFTYIKCNAQIYLKNICTLANLEALFIHNIVHLNYQFVYKA